MVTDSTVRAEPVITTRRPHPERLDGSAEMAPYHWVILLLALMVLTLGFWLDLDGRTGVRVPGVDRLPEICMTRRMLHVDCPGCGLTRSVISMMHGDLSGAFQFNIAGPFMFLLIAFQVPYRGLALTRIYRRQDTPYLPGGFLPLGFIMFMMMVQWFVRLGLMLLGNTP